MQGLEYIDDYFKGKLGPQQVRQFEEQVENDPAFAAEVAFYCNAAQLAKQELDQEKKARFRELYRQQPKTADVQTKARVRRLWPGIAAAAVVASLIFGVYLFQKPSSPERMAENYISTELATLGTTMSGTADSLETGRILYNNGQFERSLQVFKNIIASDTSRTEAKIYAGLVSLKLEYYDQALQYFREVDNTSLQVNPGKFYQALTLMKRNQPGDAEQANQLLRIVVEKDLGKNEIAQQWLDEW
jgi:tetratricopeptide (TPR) repeat protein